MLSVVAQQILTITRAKAVRVKVFEFEAGLFDISSLISPFSMLFPLALLYPLSSLLSPVCSLSPLLSPLFSST